MTLDPELCFRPTRELAELVRTRQVSSVELVRAHLDVIERVNPQVNAIVTLDAEGALAQAKDADARLAAGEPVGPLHGLPWAAKDTHDTAAMRTTSGSPVLADNVPDADELVVERIRAAGAILLGKTNVPEFATGSHTTNPVFGLTRNPYDLNRSAGGSSGGAAVALATGMVPVAEGSDMGGSLRNPASFCNVVGLRPSPGRVPSHPGELAWQTLGVQGPMGRTVDDVALLLSVLAGPDARDPRSITEPGSVFADPLPADVAGLRLAFSPDLGGGVPVEREVVETLEPALAAFTDLGCDVALDCVDFADADEVFRTLRAWTFERGFRQLAADHPGEIGEFVMHDVEIGRRLTGPQIADAEAKHAALFQRVRAFFTRYDALLLPACQVLPFDASLPYPGEVAGVSSTSYLDWMRALFFVSATGCPAISVPAGFTGGAPDSEDGGAPTGGGVAGGGVAVGGGALPVGLQIVGPYRGERRVLALAAAFEQATGFGARRPVLPV